MSELSTMTCPSWVTRHGIAHSFTELDKVVVHVIRLVSFLTKKTIPNKKKCKKAKWLSEEALQRVEKRRDAKGQGEKKRYTHLNVEFQRIARRDKKAFLSDQCKVIEENT